MNVDRRYKKNKRGGLLVLMLMLCSMFLTSCGKQGAKTADVISQKPADKEKTQITVLVKYAFSIDEFENAVEQKFPQIDLVQVGNYTRDMGIEEYAARMEHDDLTDIVMTWPLEVGSEYWDDRLLDLSGMEFTSRYNISMLNDIAKEGKLYYLPGPAQLRGIVYNKTLFEENGWQVPNNYEEFLTLCQTIEATGIRAIQLGFGNEEVLDTAFVGFNYGNYFSSPQDSQWIDDYNQGTGSFGQHFDGALSVFQDMIDAQIWKPEDLKITYSDREAMLFTRKCAMVEDSVLLTKQGMKQTGTTDEFALMPFFNPGENNDWARLYMVCYVGLNKHLAEPENKEKYDIVLSLMDYISTVEGQEALAADTGAMFSSLTEAEPPSLVEIEELLPALSHGRYAIFSTLENAQDALRTGLAGMLNGEFSKEEVIRMVDEQNLLPPVVEETEVLAQASEDFTLVETGALVADILREEGNCEVALFLDNGKDGNYNGKGISGRIYKGDVTTQDIERIMPDLKANDFGMLWTASITGENLMNVLEYSVPVENNQVGWFYYFSGLKMEIDPTAAQGQRIKKVTTADGKSIDPTRSYTIALTEGSIPEEYLENCTKTTTASYDLIADAVKQAGTISPSKDGRFQIVTSE